MTRTGPRDLEPARHAGTAGAVLRQARITAGLTQGDLARRADTAQSAVSRLECGVISPTIETLERMLDAAGYTLVLSSKRR